MADIARALERFKRDTKRYPSPEEYPRLLQSAGTLLQSTDEWGREMLFTSTGDEYLLASLGKDGVADFDSTVVQWPIEKPEFEGDIVIRSGVFVQFPVGTIPPPL